MAAILTDKFRVVFAEKFKDAIALKEIPGISGVSALPASSLAEVWLFFAKATGWTNFDGTATNIANDPVDNQSSNFKVYDQIIGLKRVTSAEMRSVIRNNKWASGTVYDIYRHDYGDVTNVVGNIKTYVQSNNFEQHLYETNFYVVTSEYKVYKCLDNNNNATSDEEPTGVSTSVITTTDSYKWKFMYTLSAAQQANFLSTDFMAVSPNSNPSSDQSNVISAAVDGSIDIIKIKAGGSGGTNGTFTGVNIRGDGSGGVATVTVAGGAVTAVAVTSPGSGYTFATISNQQIVTAGATSLSGAELDVIIPPKGGHGANAVEELGAFFVMLNTSLEGTESANSGDVSVANDFRKVCLIRDPKSGGSAASANTLRATTAVSYTHLTLPTKRIV